MLQCSSVHTNQAAGPIRMNATHLIKDHGTKSKHKSGRNEEKTKCIAEVRRHFDMSNTGVTNNIISGCIPFRYLTRARTLIFYLLAYSAIINVIRHTCASPAMTGLNVHREKGLLNPWHFVGRNIASHNVFCLCPPRK